MIKSYELPHFIFKIAKKTDWNRRRGKQCLVKILSKTEGVLSACHAMSFLFVCNSWHINIRITNKLGNQLVGVQSHKLSVKTDLIIPILRILVFMSKFFFLEFWSSDVNLTPSPILMAAAEYLPMIGPPGDNCSSDLNYSDGCCQDNQNYPEVPISTQKYLKVPRSTSKYSEV